MILLYIYNVMRGESRKIKNIVNGRVVQKISNDEKKIFLEMKNLYHQCNKR